MPSPFLPEFTARPHSHRFCPLLTRTTKVLYNKFNRNDGNIKTVTLGGKTTTYTYDKLNQLTREDNQAGNFTYVWEYDDGGNILSRKKYAYTTGNLGAPTETVNYGYGNANWGDLLTSYNGQNITYDTIGNALNDGTRTYTWEHGRELVALTKDSKTWSYTYDANGMRTKRAYGSTVYRYVYNGSQLSQMTIGNNTLFFTYDAGGMPMSVVYGGEEYFYATNLQGDVVALLDGSGDVVVRYTYDAWGNVLSTTGDLADTLGSDNPLRYRGYVYDEETGLYYLQSRYYNPQWGRFINADVLISTGQGLLGYNMFAYCLNNPVNMSDPEGNWPKLSTLWFGVAVVAVVIAATAVTVISCGAAAPVVAALGGTLASAASATATIASVAYTACSVAIAATVVSAAALTQEELAKKSNTHNHSVYVLKDSDDKVQYVGRTVNIRNRAAAHSLNPERAHLKMEVVATGLTLSEARALEQAGMLYHHTVNTANKTNNQINGVSQKFWEVTKPIAKGTIDYTWNQMTNEILYWVGS